MYHRRVVARLTNQYSLYGTSGITFEWMDMTTQYFMNTMRIGLIFGEESLFRNSHLVKRFTLKFLLLSRPNHIFGCELCIYYFKGLGKTVIGVVAPIIHASIGSESQPWRTWGKGGHLSGFESHMVKDTLSGFESHMSDGCLN